MQLLLQIPKLRKQRKMVIERAHAASDRDWVNKDFTRPFANVSNGSRIMCALRDRGRYEKNLKRLRCATGLRIVFSTLMTYNPNRAIVDYSAFPNSTGSTGGCR